MEVDKFSAYVNNAKNSDWGLHMGKISHSLAVKLVVSMSLLAGCQSPRLSELKQDPFSILETVKQGISDPIVKDSDQNDTAATSLGKILDGSLNNGNSGSDFISVLAVALENDPIIISKRREVDAKSAAVGSTSAQKEFQVSSTVYGGIEDVTDNTKGIALALNASRLVYDGGLLDAQISSQQYLADSAKLDLAATLDQRALRLGKLWIELEKYEALKDQIEGRLAVLDPLIAQLEQVAKAGIGDVSKVTAAQRTVAAIRVTETNISEGYAQAQLEFSNAFGVLKKDISYNSELVSSLVPQKLSNESAQNAPALLSQYAIYKSYLAKVASLKAKDKFNVGFEARAMRPFAGSGYDSDESVGLVARKTLFTGGMLESEIAEAESSAKAALARIQATYREGSRAVEMAKQNIVSMEKAISLAKKNAELTANEIVYLRQQLVIGGSTLDSVLSAEARLYEAESKEINFAAEKQKSELTIVSALGLLSPALGL